MIRNLAFEQVPVWDVHMQAAKWLMEQSVHQTPSSQIEVYPKLYFEKKKIVQFCQEHPKWDQNLWFEVLSEMKSDEHLSPLNVGAPTPSPPPFTGDTPLVLLVDILWVSFIKSCNRTVTYFKSYREHC